MDKKEFLLKQIAKTNKKNYENYIVTRIIHGLDDLSVKVVTQQYVTRPGDGRAFTDLFFPQVGVHVEVDEAHHRKTSREDAVRDADIVDATNHEILRINAAQPLEEIHRQIEKVVHIVQSRVCEQVLSGSFRPWDPELEYDPKTHVRRGYIDVNDDVAFRKIVDACNCFGHSYKGLQTALARHPHYADITLWFPKLYDNAEWSNQISDDECIIYERNKIDNESFIEESLSRLDQHRRIVFARVRGPLGDVMYRFKGLYEVDVETSWRTRTITYNRVATRVKTFPPS